ARGGRGDLHPHADGPAGAGGLRRDETRGRGPGPGGGSMKILVLNQYFHPDRSATSQLLTDLCEDLAEHHEVYVVTGRPSYDPGETGRSRGLVSRERYGRVRVARVWSTTFHRS